MPMPAREKRTAWQGECVQHGLRERMRRQGAGMFAALRSSGGRQRGERGGQVRDGKTAAEGVPVRADGPISHLYLSANSTALWRYSSSPPLW